MSKKKILLIAVALVIVVVGIIAAVISQKEKEMDPEELLERFEKAAEEVLGEDIQRVSQTELVATLTYSHETDKDNNIYYRVLKTTYFEADDPESVTGLNTEALNALFPVDMMDSCEEIKYALHLGVPMLSPHQIESDCCPKCKRLIVDISNYENNLG